MNSRLKSVIFAWNYLEWGGAQMYFLGIARRIKQDFDICFVLPAETDRQFLNFCEQQQIKYEFLDNHNDLQPAPNLKRKIQRHWNKFRAERSLLKYLFNLDLSKSVVHVELAPWQSLMALMMLSRKTRVFVTMHNRLPNVAKWRWYLWKLKFWIISKFSNFHLFASNQDAKESLKPLVSSDFFDKITVTYTNVNPDEIEQALGIKIEREALFKNLGLPTDKFLIFCLGQFIDRKGRWTFLEAAQNLLKNTNAVAFVWISNSKLTENEIKKIDNYKLTGQFFLINSDSIGNQHIDLMKYLRLADVFTLPSFVEGLPISLLEAMALGIPCISTNINAIPEAIRDLETGLLIEAGNSQALAGAIGKLLDDRQLREKLSKSGRDHVLRNFNEIEVAAIASERYAESFNNTNVSKNAGNG